jgi:hypothetical protein
VPECYGKWHPIDTRFKRWSENGLFWFLVYQRQQKKKITVDIRWVDSTIIGIHQYRSGALKKGAQAIGRGRKGVGTKIHVALSPEKIQGACLSANNQVDLNELASLWRQSNWHGINYIVADKGYDCGKVRTPITAAGKTAVIPRKKDALYPGVRDKERYKTHCAIERFFGKIKENKRLDLRVDKLEVTFFSFFALGCLKALNLLC